MALLVSNVLVIRSMHYVTQVKKVFVWNGSNPDHILLEGHLLYKSLNTTDLLSVDELPRSVQLYDFSVPVIWD